MEVCKICLLDFETDHAHIPDLDCECILIVHEECWERWNDTCIYCRQPGTVEIIAIAYPEERIQTSYCYIYVVVLLMYIIMLTNII
jgi:hypothetical protein